MKSTLPQVVSTRITSGPSLRPLDMPNTMTPPQFPGPSHIPRLRSCRRSGCAVLQGIQVPLSAGGEVPQYHPDTGTAPYPSRTGATTARARDSRGRLARSLRQYAEPIMGCALSGLKLSFSCDYHVYPNSARVSASGRCVLFSGPAAAWFSDRYLSICPAALPCGESHDCAFPAPGGGQ